MTVAYIGLGANLGDARQTGRADRRIGIVLRAGCEHTADADVIEEIERRRLGLRHPPAERRDLVIPPPLVVQVRIRPLVRLFDEPLREHLADRSVEDARAEGQPAVGAAGNLALERIPMPLPVGQAEQDLEHRRRQRQKVVGSESVLHRPY